MKKQTATRLLSLNKQFYQTFGNEFSSTRQHLQPGVLEILDKLRGGESILDLGCGNGELARELMRRGHRGMYVGVDFSRSLLDIARHGWEDSPATFVQADLMTSDWRKKIADLNSQPFDWVTAFAVLHHLPGEKVRSKILHDIHSLLRTGGFFVHSEWQFLKSEKLKGRIQPWETIGLAAGDVDPGDYLLDWRGGGQGFRYVHHFDEAELQELADESRFRIREIFNSDGQSGLLGLYQLWEAL